MGELGHRAVDPLDRTGLPALEDRGDRRAIPALHVLRDVGLGLQLRILPRQAEERGLEVRLLLREPALLHPPAVEILLEFLEALPRFLRGRVEFFELPFGVVVLDRVLLAGFLEQPDLGLDTGHRLLRAVAFEDQALELLLDLVDLVVQGDDLFLDVEDLRVALRRDLVDFMEILVGPFDLLVQFPDALVDVPALPCERVRLLLDLGFLLVGLRRVRPDLLQRLLRCLDSVRRAGPLDPQAIELFLELLRLVPAAVRHLLLEFVQSGDGRIEAASELLLLGLQLRLVALVLRNLLPRPDDLPFDQFPILVGELGLRGRQLLVQVPVFQGAVAVRLELLDLLVDLVEDDPDSLEVVLRLLALPFGLADVIVELRDARDVVENPPAFHGGHGDDPLDVPLLDQVVAFRRDPRVGQERVELGQGGLSVVDVEVRIVPAIDGWAEADVAGELDLVRLDGDLAVRVVEDQADLAFVGAVLVLAAVPDEVRQLAGADRLRALRAEDEQDRVRDVALPGAVRARDRRVPLEERDRDFSTERLEVLHLDLFQEQGLT